jgi:formate dehydrogenase major subunit
MNMASPGASFELTLDGRTVTAHAGETLWQVAKRAGERIPHLCLKDAPGYRADGNCRACMVEIEGERTLAASCVRQAVPGMVVKSASSTRARVAREGVMELLLADQPGRGAAPDRSSHFWATVGELGLDPAMAGGSLPRRGPEPAAPCRSTTSSAWPIAAPHPGSCSISKTPWARAPASPAASACRPARPAR